MALTNGTRTQKSRTVRNIRGAEQPSRATSSYNQDIFRMPIPCTHPGASAHPSLNDVYSRTFMLLQQFPLISLKDPRYSTCTKHHPWKLFVSSHSRFLSGRPRPLTLPPTFINLHLFSTLCISSYVFRVSCSLHLRHVFGNVTHHMQPILSILNLIYHLRPTMSTYNVSIVV